MENVERNLSQDVIRIYIHIYIYTYIRIFLAKSLPEACESALRFSKISRGNVSSSVYL